MKADIVTYTGKAFNIFKPDPKLICIEDIAHALSNICRYNGHTRNFYSVAEHCVRASYLTVGKPLINLLHDSAEAYVGDMVSPHKRNMFYFNPYPVKNPIGLTLFAETEMRILDIIGVALGVDNLFERTEHQDVHKADMIMFVTEIRDLMPEYIAFEPWDGGIIADAKRIEGWEPKYAEHEYLRRYKELSHEPK